MRAAHPNKPPRVALFDSSSAASTEHTSYAMQRHAYLVSKIADLRRKHKTIAFRNVPFQKLLLCCASNEKVKYSQSPRIQDRLETSRSLAAEICCVRMAAFDLNTAS